MKKKLTRETAKVHALQILRFKDDDGEFSGGRNVSEREADVTQFVLLQYTKTCDVTFRSTKNLLYVTTALLYAKMILNAIFMYFILFFEAPYPTNLYSIHKNLREHVTQQDWLSVLI